jgi:hypothetical protein
MGITIHYRFMIRNRDALCSMLKEIKGIAVKLGMKILQQTETCLVIHPHANSESLNLDFERYADVKDKGRKNWSYEAETLKDFNVLSDEDFVCSSFTKTQYAGYKIHILVAEILRKVASRCMLAYVSDEAGYYETRDKEKTAKNFDESNKMISMIAATLKETFGKDRVYCAIDHTEKS